MWLKVRGNKRESKKPSRHGSYMASCSPMHDVVVRSVGSGKYASMHGWSCIGCQASLISCSLLEGFPVTEKGYYISGGSLFCA
jgi:hypothetical protein